MALSVERRGVFIVAAGIFYAGCATTGAVAQVRPADPPTVTPSASPSLVGQLDPQSPLAELPGLGVAWPDLSKAPEEPADPQARAALTGDTRYDYRVDGIDAVASSLLKDRFAQLSTLKANAKDSANAAQLDRRAREDATLLTTLLRSEGYYDARVATRIEPNATRPLVVLDAEPGVLYTFQGVTVAGIDAAGDKAGALRTSFGVTAGDAVNADAVAAGETSLRKSIADGGFPFAVIGDPQIVVDRAARTATLDMAVVPGGVRRFGAVTMTSGTRLFDARHVQDIARFAPGAPYDASALVDLRRALIQTGLVSTVKVEPVEGKAPGTVDIAVGLEPAPPHTIAGQLGYGTGEGARAEISWTHRNLFPPEGALTVRGVLGTREQLASVIFRRNNFNGRDRILTGSLTASNLTRDAYQARTFALAGSLERQTNIFFQKEWTWSLGGEVLASEERDVIVTTGAPRRRIYFIGALPTTLSYDGSDDLLDPTRGFRLSGRLSPEVSLEGSAFAYARVQLDSSGYRTVARGTVLAGRVRLGTIAGAPRDAVAPSRRFYAGGGASVRGYSYQGIGPRDPNNVPIGGRSLAEFSIEARVKAFGNFGLVPFLDGGNISTGTLPSVNNLRFGAGVGVRYYSNFGPIRIDVGTPLNPQKGDPRVAVYVSLGQAF
ncbi:autotransporter assembly complex family protein [Sphingomonas sp.]|uniref:autotransporter assembly complex protein TamA n=1 Tax=Sphingomonas sp. TaxID=28214 RepID=UPI003342BAEB